MPARSPEDCDRLFAECAKSGDLKALVALYESRGSLMRVDGGVATSHSPLKTPLPE